jgi:hypothetical protein
MTTHATISVKTPKEVFHANMLADGQPNGFGRDLRDIFDSVTPKESESAPALHDLKDAFFPSSEYDPSELFIQPTDCQDSLGDAWYRYELNAATDPIKITAFGRNYDGLGWLSLSHGWRVLFSGTLEAFYAWCEKFDPDVQAELDSMKN